MEQTSSTAYPNVLALRYLRQTGQVAPQIAMKAEEYVNLGYQRLLTFESPTGGFNWWGNDEAGNLILTALGIQQFKEIGAVQPIDERIVQRSQQWLVRQQQNDGSWALVTHLHGYNMSLGQSAFNATAYILNALIESGYVGPATERAAQWLYAHLASAENDAYALAMAANALVAFNPRHAHTQIVLDRLKALAKVEAGSASWATGQTLTYSTGRSGSIETTALAAQALLKARREAELSRKALAFLVSNKDAYGTWQSTQATVLALKALLLAQSTPAESRATIRLRLNDDVEQTVTVTPENSDVLQLVDFGTQTRTGQNTLTIEAQGQANLMYQAVARHYLPWQQVAPREQEPLFIEVEYDRTELAQNDQVKALVHVQYRDTRPTFMVIVDLGVPPGFTPLTDAFDRLVRERKITRWSQTDRQIILYLGALKPGASIDFGYSLLARFPVRAKTPKSRVYEYYTPAKAAESQPVLMVVKP